MASQDQVDAPNTIPDFSGIPKEQLMELMEKRGHEVGTFIREKFGSSSNLMHKLHTSAKKGIKPFQDALEHRQDVFGKNYTPLESFSARSVLRFFKSAVLDWVVIILVVAAIFSLILGLLFPEKCEGKEKFAVAWYEGVGILATVAVMIILAALADFLHDRDMRSMQEKINAERRVCVIRDGTAREILAKEITVGDLCQLKAGSVIPADGIAVHQSDNLWTDEMVFDVKEPVHKKHEELLFAGSHVVEGVAKMIILAVGANTELRRWKPSSAAQGGSSSTAFSGSVKIIDSKQVNLYPTKDKEVAFTLQGKINKLNYYLGIFSLILAVITVLVIVIRFSVHMYSELDLEFETSQINDYIRAFIMGVVVVILVLPEGLPLVLNISMAFCIRKLNENKCLVRHADIIEDMGNITTICCNKTGVLTENRMAVSKSYIAEKTFEGEPRSYKGNIPSNVYADLIKAIAINTSYAASVKEAGRDHLPRQIGNKTDAALLQFVLEFGDTYETLRDEYPEERFTKVFEFTPETKFMAVVIPGEQTGDFKLYVKGATEFVLARCTHMFGAGGEAMPISKEDKDKIYKDVAKQMQLEGLRILCLASRDFTGVGSGSEKVDWNNQDLVLSNLVLQAIVGIEDPVREEVPRAISQCHKGNITVRMVTRDNLVTAESVAIKCGILDPRDKYYVYTGHDFNEYIRDPNDSINQARFDAMWTQMPVLARASPFDKFNLVNGIKKSCYRHQHGEVVAVTGSSVHDGPVLTLADVGFTMSVAGTDVAKESSDVILLDDDFSSIVRTIKWGRNVFETLLKFLQFEITVSFVAIVVVFVGACILGRSPLVATQLLWINLIMDSLASLALTRDTPSPEILRQKPFGQHKPLITRSLLRNVIGHSIFQLVVIFVLIFKGADLFDITDGFKPDTFCKPSQHASLVFTTFVFMQLFNEINSRKVQERNVFQGIFENYVFIIIWIAQAAFQILIVQFFTTAFHVDGMDLQQWMWCLFLGFSELLWAQLVLTVPKKILPAGITCISGGYNKGRGISYLRSNSRADQQDGGPLSTLKRPSAGGPLSPPPEDKQTFFEKWEESHEGGGGR